VIDISNRKLSVPVPVSVPVSVSVIDIHFCLSDSDRNAASSESDQVHESATETVSDSTEAGTRSGLGGVRCRRQAQNALAR
jgi:hypothetical protein